jgi:hypothetical protein
MNVDRWQKVGTWASAVALAGALGLGGCAVLGAKDQARVEAISADLKVLQEQGTSLAADLRVVVEKAKSGDIPVAEALNLAAKIESQQDEIKAKADDLVKQWTEAKANGVNPWALAGSVLLNVLTGAAGITLRGKLGVVGEAFGAISRVADVVGGDRVGPAMAAEIAAAPTLTTEIMKALHTQAKDKSL